MFFIEMHETLKSWSFLKSSTALLWYLYTVYASINPIHRCKIVCLVYRILVARGWSNLCSCSLLLYRQWTCLVINLPIHPLVHWSTAGSAVIADAVWPSMPAHHRGNRKREAPLFILTSMQPMWNKIRKKPRLQYLIWDLFIFCYSSLKYVIS